MIETTVIITHKITRGKPCQNDVENVRKPCSDNDLEMLGQGQNVGLPLRNSLQKDTA